MNNKMIKTHLGTVLLMGVMSFGFSTLNADIGTEVDGVAKVDVAQLQAAIEAFGVSSSQAEQAASVSVSMIEDQQEKSGKKYQEIADLPDDLIDMNPY